MKSILRLTRAFIGTWSELRKIRVLIEWLMVNGMAVTGSTDPLRLNIILPHLPPTAKEIKDAENEKREYNDVTDEDVERAAGEALVESYKRKKAGEQLDDDNPADKFNIFE